MGFKRFISSVGLKLKKNSPAILTVSGVVGLTAAGVLACVQTTKAHAVIERHQEALKEVHEAKELEAAVGYTEKDYRSDLVKVYARTGFEWVKLYAGPVALAGVSIVSILAGHHILSKRHAALGAAYNALQTAFTEYQKAVKEEVGEDKEKEIRYKATKRIAEREKAESGGEVKMYNGRKLSPYARFFDESSNFWTADPLTNKNWIIAQQNWANELLKSRGNVFLNEVYDALGFPRTSAGAICGWVLSDDGSTDNYIDFGLNRDDVGFRNFINEEEPNILLDFNVDGPIYDLL